MRRLAAVVLATLVVGALAEVATAQIYVRGHFRSNGTYVAPYYPSSPGANFYNNFSGTYVTPYSPSNLNVNSYNNPSGTYVAPYPPSNPGGNISNSPNGTYVTAYAPSNLNVNYYSNPSGTYVAPYSPFNPNGNPYNNWSTYPKVNPYTGVVGTLLVPTYVFYSYPPSPVLLPSYSIPWYRPYYYSPY
jgi:hypothetical protein